MHRENFFDFCKFQPKQLEAAQAVEDYTYILFGGAVGGGKSFFLRWIAVYLLMIYFAQIQKPGIRVGLFCEDYVALADRHLSKIQYEFPEWLGTLNRSNHEFVLKDGYGAGVIVFRNLDDPSKYLSSEFAAILVDEVTMNERSVFDFLNLRRRWPGIENTKFICASNPGGIGHGWVKKLWIDRDFTGEQFDPKDFVFVRSQAKDNKYLPESYSKQLEGLPEKMRKAFLEGNWDIFEGQYFPEFSKDKHVIEPFEIPQGWTRFRSIDYGYEAPAAVLWYAVDYDGNVYVYRELYQRGLLYKDLALKIREMSDPDENGEPKEKFDYNVADTDMFAATRDTGEYGYDIMGNNGVPITPANKERIPGWNLVRKYLQEGTLKIFSTCTNLIRTFPLQIHDEHKPEDLKKGGEDHLCLIGTTMIRMADQTEKQIKDIKVGECVMTPLGAKEVLASTCTGIRKVIEVKMSNGRSLIGTGDHNVYTVDGKETLDSLRMGSIMRPWVQMLHLTDNNTTLMENIMFRLKDASTVGNGYTLQFGNFGTDPSRKDLQYTTLMEIGEITTSATSTVSAGVGTLNTTQKNDLKTKSTKKRWSSIWKGLDLLQRNGMLPKRVVYGIKNTERIAGKVGKKLIKFVQSVVENTKRHAQKLLSTVRTYVNRKLNVCVTSKRRLRKEREVYNLTVADVHCYYAQGVLVANCDSARMGLMSLPQLPVMPKEERNPYASDPDSPWGKPRSKGYKNIYSYT